MASVIWLEEALVQLNAAIAYVRMFDPAAARRLGDRPFDAGNSLVDFPRRGRPAAHDTRELVTVRPYILQYEVLDDDSVQILGVRHAAQRSEAD